MMKQHPLIFRSIRYRPLEPTEISASFSVPELANYARCPLRYQLENVLRIPTNGQGKSGSDEIDMSRCGPLHPRSNQTTIRHRKP